MNKIKEYKKGFNKKELDKLFNDDEDDDVNDVLFETTKDINKINKQTKIKSFANILSNNNTQCKTQKDDNIDDDDDDNNYNNKSRNEDNNEVNDAKIPYGWCCLTREPKTKKLLVSFNKDYKARIDRTRIYKQTDKFLMNRAIKKMKENWYLFEKKYIDLYGEDEYLRHYKLYSVNYTTHSRYDSSIEDDDFENDDEFSNDEDEYS